MKSVSHLAGCVLFLVIVCSCSHRAAAAPTPEEVKQLREVAASIKQASVLFRGKKFAESAELIKSAQSTVSALKSGPNAKQIARNLAPVEAQLKKAHALLARQGIQLPPLDTSKPGENARSGENVSFVRDVAPMLVAKCGRCHIERASGQFSIANFAALEKGPPEGVVFSPGKSQGSRIIDVIESGDMPRGGATVSKEELIALAKWIDQGAMFDGSDKSLPLARLVPQAGMPAAQSPQLMVSTATGNETVSFAKDIAPVLMERCGSCHAGRNPRGNLNLASFTTLLRGGDSDAPWKPGDPAESLLVKRLKGIAGDRMPLGADPLSDDVIAKFETWIKEGATFDGPDAQMPTNNVIAYVYAKNASHEELSTRRSELAAEKWRLAIPDDTAAVIESKNFRVTGNVNEATLKKVQDIAEQQVAVVAKALRMPNAEPFIKGRMTIYVFQQRFDYSEFGKMVEGRTPPDIWMGHWGYDVVDAYAAVLSPRNDSLSLEALIAQQVTATFVASLGRVPTWFSEGTGRAIAARTAPKDTRVREWEDRLPTAIASAPKPDAFTTNEVPPEDAAILSYSFVKFLMSKPAQFAMVLEAVRKGENFDASVTKAYGANLQSLTAMWAARAAGKRR